MFGKLQEESINLCKALQETFDALVEAFQEIAEVIRAKLEEFEEWEDDNDGKEWQRAREREAVKREKRKARARYKAHGIMMAKAKARRNLRWRKQRQYKSMGWN